MSLEYQHNYIFFEWLSPHRWGKFDPGTYRKISTGYFQFLNDLSPGKHEIELKVVDLLKRNEETPPIFVPM